MAKNTPDTHLVTQLLHEARDGSKKAQDELVTHVYAQLRKIAQKRMSNERADHTLQPTELVHEAYLKMAGSIDGREWQGRAHFYAAAAEAMRRILINHARSRNTIKRGGGQRPEAVNVLDLAEADNPEHILALDEAIEKLRAYDEKLGQLVHLRFFAGLSVDETAEALEISRRSVIRHWNFARAWLAREMSRSDETPAE